MKIERAIEILKWPDTGAGPCPSMLESAEAGRMGAEALEIVQKTAAGREFISLPDALRLAAESMRRGVYGPGQRALINEAAGVLDAVAKLAEAPACEADSCPVIYPDEDLNRRSGLLEDD